MSSSLSITNSSPQKIRENIFISYLTEEVKDYHRIYLSEIIALGYSPTTRKLIVNEGYNAHYISELIDPYDKRIVDFCFFWSRRTKEGFVVNQVFNYYVDKKIAIRDSVVN